MVRAKKFCLVCAAAMCLSAIPVMAYADVEEPLKIETEVFEPSGVEIQETEVVILMDSEPVASVSEKKSELLRISGEKDKNPDFLEWMKGKINILIGGRT